jgi:hypothetical protein
MTDKPPLTFDICWNNSTPELREAVMQFWLNSRLLSAEEAEKRVAEVVMTVRDEQNEIIGISTAYKAFVKQLGHHFYMFRCAIREQERHPGLTSLLLVKTRDHLESIHQNDEGVICKGLMTVVENPRINETRREAVWPASKMVYIGATKDGRQIRLYYFKGARI